MFDPPAVTATKPTDKPVREHSVVDGKILRLSASQIKSFDNTQDGGCARKWHYDKVQHIPQPERTFLRLGSDTDKIVERYVLTGEDALTPIARAGKHLIHRAEGGIHVQRPLTALKFQGIPIIGFMDQENTSGFWINPEGELLPQPSGEMEVNDWKTTGDMKWAKTGPGLLHDVQMPVYGLEEIDTSPWIERVRLSHTYFQTRGPKHAEKRTILVDRQQLEERRIELDSVVATMVDVARETDIEKIEFNPHACRAYGGCPYMDRCPKPINSLITSLFGSTNKTPTPTQEGRMASLKDRMMGKSTTAPAAAAPATTPQVPAAAPAPQVVTPPTAAEVAASKARFIATEAAAGLSFPPAATPPPPAAVDPWATDHPGQNAQVPAESAKPGKLYWIPNAAAKESNGWSFAKAVGVSTGGFSFLNPTAMGGTIVLPGKTVITEVGTATPQHRSKFDAPVQVAPPVPVPVEVAPPPVPVPVEVAPPPVPGEVVPAQAAIPPPPAPVVAPLQPVQAAQAVLAAPTPVLAATTATVPNYEAPAGIAPPDAPASDPAKAADPIMAEGAVVEAPKVGRTRKTKTAGAGTGAAPQTDTETDLTIYCNCVTSRPTSSLQPYCETLCEKLAQQFKVPDIRYSEKDGPSHVLGFGAWKGILAGFAKAEPPTPGSYTLMVGTDERYDVIVNALSSVAEIVRGVR